MPQETPFTILSVKQGRARRGILLAVVPTPTLDWLVQVVKVQVDLFPFRNTANGDVKLMER